MAGVQLLVNQFIKEVRRRKNEASDSTACLTVELLRSVISQQKLPQTNQAQALVDAVKSVGEQLTASNPSVLVVGNIVKRVLHIIREEDQFLLAGAVGELKLSDGSDDVDTVVLDDDNKLVPSPAAMEAISSLRPPTLRALLEGVPNSTTTNQSQALETASERKGDQNPKGSWKLKGHVIESLNNLIEDINICHEQIAEQAVELIHQNEIILTLGHSKTVLEFLCAAKEKKRSFKVFVAEGAPSYQGHVLAKELVARKLSTTVITDSAVFAIISRVNMVVVGVHAVMANGGVMGPVGLNMVALAAQKHSVPLVVVAGTHKLCPLYPHNPEVLLNEMMSPAELLSFEDFSDNMDFQIGNGAPLLHVVNPGCDYVPPKFVSLFITDEGGHNPSFMHRLVSDYYSADDIVGQQNPTS